MPLYLYSALNQKGHKVRGKINAANELDLENRLKVINLDLISCKAAKNDQNTFGAKVTIKDLILFCIHVEQLEQAGVPILDAIADLRDTSENAKFKNVMADIFERVKSGEMFSDALSHHPKVFNNIFTSLVAAGEKTGDLHQVFSHLASHLKWVNDIQRKIKKSIYYPSFLLLLMAGIIALMMLFVIPKLSDFLQAQDFDLPFYTEALIATSNFFTENWHLVLIIPPFIYFTIKILIKISSNFAYNADVLVLNLPYIGSTIRKIELARFCRFFAVTYRSGIGVLDCLDIANNVVKNKVIKENISLVRKGVSEGNSLTACLTVSNQFPSLVVRMFKVGEESGNLDKTLKNVNFFYDREVDDSVNKALGAIHPTLTIIMGAIMMWVSLAVFGPLYSSFSKINF